MGFVRNEMDGSGRGKYTLDGAVEYRFEYQVHDDADAILTGPILYANARALSIPRLGDKLTGTSAICEVWEPFPIDSNRNNIWQINLVFKTQETNENPDKPQIDPRNQPAIVRFGSVEKQITLTKGYQEGDAFGAPSEPIVSPVTMPYDPAPSDTRSVLLIIIDKNYREMDPELIPLYKNTVNVNSMSIGGVKAAPRLARLREFIIEPGWTGDDEQYDKVHFEFELDPEGHDLELLAQGFYAFQDADDKETIFQIKTSDLNEDVPADEDGFITDPVNLDATGKINFLGDPYYQTFRSKFAKDFAPLGIPERRDGTE